MNRRVQRFNDGSSLEHLEGGAVLIREDRLADACSMSAGESPISYTSSPAVRRRPRPGPPAARRSGPPPPVPFPRPDRHRITEPPQARAE